MEIAPGDHLSHPNCSLCTRKPRIMCVHHSVLFHLWHTTGQLTVFKSSKQINSMAADGRILFYFFFYFASQYVDCTDCVYANVFYLWHAYDGRACHHILTEGFTIRGCMFCRRIRTDHVRIGIVCVCRCVALSLFSFKSVDIWEKRFLIQRADNTHTHTNSQIFYLILEHISFIFVSENNYFRHVLRAYHT